MVRKFKQKKWRTPNRMLFESGYRTFDREVDVITDGNVCSRVQLSGHIRKVSDLNDDPSIRPGQCRAFDLRMFESRGVPVRISDYLHDHPEEEFWLYCWHFPNGGRTVGWILTDARMTMSLVRVSCGRVKPFLALCEAEKYVVKGDWK